MYFIIRNTKLMKIIFIPYRFLRIDFYRIKAKRGNYSRKGKRSLIMTHSPLTY